MIRELDEQTRPLFARGRGAVTEPRPTGCVLEDLRAAPRRHARSCTASTSSVARGELLVVLGPSGAGKSTLLRVVAGLEPATGGRVVIAGRDVTAAAARAAQRVDGVPVVRAVPAPDASPRTSRSG